jgi:hypothetical protein
MMNDATPRIYPAKRAAQTRLEALSQAARINSSVRKRLFSKAGVVLSALDNNGNFTLSEQQMSSRV